ncbi:MAG: GldG family protein [Betaproteobacteria bacterium]|nr:GldG family protein [Betaproteobacteria bacterium]
MSMKNKNLETLMYSAGGIIALALILIAGNFIFSALNARVDLTEGRVYTLSDGTRSILSKLEAPVKIRFYYTQGSAAVPPGLKTFAGRVEDLLNEYKAASNGKVIIEKFNPQPDSDAEDSAALDNVEGQMTNTGEKFYLGLAVSFLDQKSSIPVLTPDRERLLEYDITRSISQVGQAKKPVIGVMSNLPVLGRSLDPVKKQQPTEPWVLASELKRIFDVRKVEMNATKIDDDIKVLLVIHPRDILETTEYAIDQFVMRGGKLIAFVDTYAYFDQQPDLQNPFGGNAAGQSTLHNLFKAWGVEPSHGKVVADLTFASGEGPRLLPTLLSLNTEALNMDDVVTSQVGTLLIPFGASFTIKPPEGLKQTTLVHTSKNSMLADLIIATLSGEPSTRGFQPSGKEEPLAFRLSGKFKTAFPNGKPADPFARGKPVDPVQFEADRKAHRAEAAAENTVVIAGDVDMLTDGAAVEIQEIFGQRVAVPRNGNLAFAQGLVEQMAGDSALINLRSRAAFSRPLTAIKQIEARAQETYLGKIKELEDTLNQTTEKLQALQKGGKSATASGGTILTPDQQAEMDNFRNKSIETRRELKEVRKNLREETESLQLWTKVINIALIPLLVIVLGVSLAIIRRRKINARASAS